MVRPPLALGMSLDVVVQVLVRVAFKTVGRQVEQLDLVRVLGYPLLDLVGSMHRMAVHDEKHLVLDRAHQAAQKVQKYLGGETALEHLKAQGAVVG